MRFTRTFVLGLCMAGLLLIPTANSQTNPRQEKLLNGLRVLMWSSPTDKVQVRLRIHAGAVFDPQGKEGVAKLLAEAIFPNPDIREFFKDELGGNLEIVTKYDYVEFVASSKPEQFLRMLEALAPAISNPTIDKDTVEAVRPALLASVVEDEKKAAHSADSAAAQRLLGTFPYGRPLNGSAQSLQRIDFADLRFFYDRLFGADNATLTISGNFEPGLGFRAVRRYFGSWRKADRTVPATFRQPDPPPAGTQMVRSPEAGVAEIRYATRGIARNEKDYPAVALLSHILDARIRAKVPADRRGDVFVRHQTTLLPGMLMIGFTDIRREMTAAITGEKPKIEANDVIWSVLNDAITAAEFSAAKAAVFAERGRIDDATMWLDAYTFRLASVKQDSANFDAVTLADVQRVAHRIKSQPMASVLVLPTTNT